MEKPLFLWGPAHRTSPVSPAPALFHCHMALTPHFTQHSGAMLLVCCHNPPAHFEVGRGVAPVEMHNINRVLGAKGVQRGVAAPPDPRGRPGAAPDRDNP